MTRVAVLGVGAVGARVARQLLSTGGRRRGGPARRAPRPPGDHRPRRSATAADRSIRRPSPTRSTPTWWCWPAPPATTARWPAASSSGARRWCRPPTPSHDVQGLLDLDPEARERGVSVAVGGRVRPRPDLRAGRPRRGPLRRGRRGPRGQGRHRRARPAPASTIGRWAAWRSTGATAVGCSDRPAAGASCAGSPTRSGPRTATGPRCPTPWCWCRPSRAWRRVTARLAANRRDRLTARLPMLRPPHPEGGPGAVRVEVRGRRGTSRDVTVLGAMDRPAVAAGAVAALSRAVGWPRAACGARGRGGPGRAGRAGALPGRAAPARGAGRGVPARRGRRSA